MPKNKDFARVPPCSAKAAYPFKTLDNNNVFFVSLFLCVTVFQAAHGVMK